jgi:hypothetical protein
MKKDVIVDLDEIDRLVVSGREDGSVSISKQYKVRAHEEWQTDQDAGICTTSRLRSRLLAEAILKVIE